MSRDTDLIQCERHGRQPAAYLCVHLLRSEEKGFVSELDDQEAEPVAWCSRCERSRVASGGEWNDYNVDLMDLRLVCRNCYGEIKLRQLAQNGEPHAALVPDSAESK